MTERESAPTTFSAPLKLASRRGYQGNRDAFGRWRRYIVMVLDVAIEQCERRNLTAPANMAPSDLPPPDLVAALIEQLQLIHNLEVHSPSSNQHALEMLFALQHFYLPYADADEAAKEALARQPPARDRASDGG